MATKLTIKLNYSIAIILDFIFLVLVFFFPFSIALRNMLLGLLIIFYIISKLINKELSLPKTEFNIYIYIFFIIGLLSIFKTNNINLSLARIISPILRYIFFYFIAFDLIKKDRITKYINIIFASNILFLGYGFYDFFRGGKFLYGNGTGTLLAFIIIFSLSYLFENKVSLHRRVILTLIIVGGLMALYISYSRGATLGFFGGLLVLAVLLIQRNYKNKRLIAVICLITILLFTSLLVSDKLIAKFKRIMDFDSSWSLKTRVLMWRSSLIMIRENPLLGVGVGNFRPNYLYIVDNIFKIKIPESSRLHDHPHNLFLFIGAEQGLISLLLFIIMLYKAYYLGFFNYKKSISLNYVIGLALIGMLTVLVIHSMVDTTARYGHVGFYILLFLIFNMKLARN